MDSSVKQLTCISYNYEYADDSRLSFLKELYHKNDFLILQEHGLYKSQFGWFNKLGIDVGKHRASAIGEIFLKGRPRGGSVIHWKGSLNAKVIPVENDSQRVCAVTVEIQGTRILFVCTYIPCEDNRPNHSIVDFKIALNDIKTIFNSVNVQHVILGGDFNTNCRRSSYFTTAFNEYINDEFLYPCIKCDCNTVQCT